MAKLDLPFPVVDEAENKALAAARTLLQAGGAAA